MKNYLIFAACFVNIEWISARENNEVANQFQNLLDSIAQNNVKESGTYRETLKQDVAKEQQAFGTLEEELWTARNRNFYRRKYFHNKSNANANVVAKKRETDDVSTTTARRYVLSPPVQLHEVGYNGTWQEFCDRDEINKDSPLFQDHPLRTVRLAICHRRDMNDFTWETAHTFAEYKYSVQARAKADEILERLLTKFSLEDSEKRVPLLALGVPKWNSRCFRDCQEWIRNYCVDRDNPYFTMLYELLTRACNLPWLQPITKIRTIMKEECEGKRLPKVDWEPMIATITYTEPA